MLSIYYSVFNSNNIKTIISVLVLFYQANCAFVESKNFTDALINLDCLDYGELENGNVTIIESNNIQALHFTCDPGFYLIGRPKYICNNGQWESVPKPVCVKGGCGDPPMVGNGEVKIEGYKEGQVFAEGIIAEYQCMPGFVLTPSSSKRRICRNGQWTGSEVTCHSEGCLSPPPLANGYIVRVSSAPPGPRYEVNEKLHFICNAGYKLEGVSPIECQVTGAWSPRIFPQCIRYPAELQQMCSPPPPLPHVIITVARGLMSANTGLAGTTLEASCENGYRDEHSPCVPQLIRCIDGSWEGRMPKCVPINGCTYPLSIANANILNLQSDNHYAFGSNVVYSCLSGYDLVGDAVFRCKPNGCWEPDILPVCHPRQTSHFYQSDTKGCSSPPTVPNGYFVTESSAPFSPRYAVNERLHYSCNIGYKLQGVSSVQCQASGTWSPHIFPQCVQYTSVTEGCMSPPPVANGYFATESSTPIGPRYMTNERLYFSCNMGYKLEGVPAVQCLVSGSWSPHVFPQCVRYPPGAWSEYLNFNTSLVISMITAATVMFILLSVCIVVICRHHHPHHHHHHRSGAPPPALAPPPPDPDRVALIAFAEGVQSVLPSYEEAMRGNGGILNYRLHRPHWSILGVQRNRNTRDNFAARQISSAGESMGSTDTMTVSEVSTNVTLDTVSSHTCSSGSQTASCRAICGSLASFDTSSVLNTEGVPLLEENELEEAVAGSVIHDPDSGSYKLQSDIASIHS